MSPFAELNAHKVTSLLQNRINIFTVGNIITLKPKRLDSYWRSTKCSIRDVQFRAQESQRAYPLFVDDAAKALLDTFPVKSNQTEPWNSLKNASRCYGLATRFLDDVIIDSVQNPNEEIRQVVLLTDGMDTRPYRLSWPPQTRIFDISPGPEYNLTANRMKEVNTRVSRGSVLRHVSADVMQGEDWRDEGWGEKLVRIGYRGDLPSVWILQGLDELSPEGLQNVLGHVGSLAMADSCFHAEIPLRAIQYEANSSQDAIKTFACNIFAKNGLLAECVSFANLAKTLGVPDDGHVTYNIEGELQYERLLISSTQRRLSEAQLEIFMSQSLAAESSGDEAGFDDAP